MATVNGKDILRADLDRKYQTWKMSQGESPQEPSAGTGGPGPACDPAPDDRRGDSAAARREAECAASDEDVNAKLTEMKAPYTQEEFDKQLKTAQRDAGRPEARIAPGLTENKLLNKEIDSKINITDAEIKATTRHTRRTSTSLSRATHLARIVVTNAPSQQADQPAEQQGVERDGRKNKIQALHQKLENGEDFGTLAMNFSEDKDTGASGGDMGFVTESQLHESASPDVYEAITKLKPGQFTEVLPMNGGPVATKKPIGYAIYKLISKEAAGQRMLNNVQVQQYIRQSLRDGHAQLLSNAYREVLRDDAKVHNYLADQILKTGAQ